MLSQEVIQHLIDPGNTQIKPGLDRIKQALALLANPHQQAKVIHITGTNGKGSTAAFIETGLIHVGYTVAKYTSPYIQQINETIRVNGLPISDAELEENFFQIKAKIKQHDITLSPFEYLTVIMFYHVAKHQPDFLILEVGMGGENDATNVVEPLFSIITNISLDHTNWLGETLHDIAKEKAGIIKQGKVIIADRTPELIDEVKLRTTNYLNVLDEYLIEPVLDAVNFRTMVEINHQTYALSLWGKFQAYNFLCAYAVFNELAVPQASITYAASHTSWPGRLEVISHNPLIILDATHNEAGAKALYESLAASYQPQEIVIITSILADKNIAGMLDWLEQLANTIIYTSISNNPRGLTAQQLAQAGQGKFTYSYNFDKPEEALQMAKQLNKKLILITGSLSLLKYFY